MELEISTITIPETRKRKLDKQKATSLAISIQELGLLQPIGVDANNTLLWGLHRLEAYKILKRASIDCVIKVCANPYQAELAEIDENLFRAELTELETATHLARRKAIYLELYPQTGHGGDRKSSRHNDALNAPTFAEDTANNTGLSARTVQRKTQIGEALGGLAEKLSGTPVEDNQKELLAIARLKDDQEAVVAKIAAGEVDSVKEAQSQLKAEEKARAKARLNGSEKAGELPKLLEPELGHWYRLGDHYLYCGDSSSSDFWQNIPDCTFAFADPPFNVEKDSWDQGFSWNHDYLTDVAAIVVVTPGNRQLYDFFRLTEMPYRWSVACYITNGMSRGDLGYGNFIPAPVFANEYVDVYRNSQDVCVVSIKQSETEDTSHKGRKPLDFMLWLLQTFTDKGSYVLDPFAGSGQTLMACEALGRVCYTAEIRPEAVAEICERFNRVTGKAVTLCTSL